MDDQSVARKLWFMGQKQSRVFTFFFPRYIIVDSSCGIDHARDLMNCNAAYVCVFVYMYEKHRRFS